MAAQVIELHGARILLSVLKTAIVCAAWALLMPVHAQSSSGPDARLLGTWQSDRDRTLQHWKFKDEGDAKTQEMRRQMFGKLKLVFDATQVSAELNGQVFKTPYRTIASDAKSVLIETTEGDKKVIQQIMFEGPFLYKLTGYNVEFFRKQ